MIQEIKTYKEWNSIFQSAKRLCVIFISGFCSDCNLLIRYASNTTLDIKIIDINILSNLANKFHIDNIPSLSLFEDRLQVFNTSKIDLIYEIINNL